MESNHRCLGVSQESLPLDHRTKIILQAVQFRGLESNQRLLGQSQASLPAATTPEYINACIKAEGEGVEPSIPTSRDDCFRNSCHRPLACPSKFTSCGGRNRTCNRLFNRELPYRLATPQNQSVRVVRFELTLSCARGTRISRLSNTLF
jgi:hypothetical protein